MNLARSAATDVEIEVASEKSGTEPGELALR
jgi:hypothetical protein